MANMQKFLDLIAEYEKAKEAGDLNRAATIAVRAEQALKDALGLRGV